MDTTVEVTLPVDAEAAKALNSFPRREAAGRYLTADGRTLGKLNSTYPKGLSLNNRAAWKEAGYGDPILRPNKCRG